MADVPERIWIDTDCVEKAMQNGVGSYYVRPSPDDTSNRDAEYVRVHGEGDAISRAEVIARLEKVVRLWMDDKITMAYADMLVELRSLPSLPSQAGEMKQACIKAVERVSEAWVDEYEHYIVSGAPTALASQRVEAVTKVCNQILAALEVK